MGLSGLLIILFILGIPIAVVTFGVLATRKSSSQKSRSFLRKLQDSARGGCCVLHRLWYEAMMSAPGIAICVLCSLPAFGQFHIEKKVDGDVMTMTYTTKGTIGVSPVPGAPYSAVVIWQQRIILPNGRQRAYPPTVTKVWRDSQGRAWDDEAMPSGAGHFVLTNITDPAAGFMYVLDNVNGVAHRSPLAIYPNREQREPTPKSGAALTVDNLGSRTIEGMPADGVLETNTFSDGDISTTESWWSPELKNTLLMISKDPKNGIRTRRATNIRREEPDSTLFRLPADYSIDDAQSFTITIKKQ